MDDEELLLDFEDIIRNAADEPKCKGRGNTHCTCLHVLRDEDYRSAVAKYLLWMARTKDKRSKDQTISEWYFLCNQMPKTRYGGVLYPIPFDGNGVENGVDLSALRSSKMCSAALGVIMEIKNTNMVSIRQGSKKGLMRAHGNVANHAALIKEDDPRMPPIRDHFESLLKLGEVRATKVMRTLVDGVEGRTTRGDDDDIVYLPCTSGKRPLFYRYGREQGYDIKPLPNGQLEVREIPNVERVPMVSWTQYRRIWARDYAQLKVSTPSEDICELCVRFRNRHKFLASHNNNFVGDALNAMEDDDIFADSDSDCEKSDDDLLPSTAVATAVQAITPPNLQAINTADEFALLVSTAQPVIEEKHPAVSNEEKQSDFWSDPEVQPMPGSTAQPPVGGTEEWHADPVNEEMQVNFWTEQEDEAKEKAELRNRADKLNVRLLLAAAVHIKMARVQRSLYIHYVAEAVNHTLANKAHNEKTYTFVVDYCQNMELPVFNSEQPGPVYYFSPLGVYTCGMVNHGHLYANGRVGAHLHAHVYHEGVAKKGANEVASFIMKTLKFLNILRNGDPGGKLVIVFDNCTGQNKNNCVLMLLMFLAEAQYFHEVEFVFLIVGHTKNSADHLFNSLKKNYHSENLFTMNQLLETLNTSEKVTVHAALPTDFFDYTTFFIKFYRKMAGMIKINHIFSASHANGRVGNKFDVTLQRSDLDEHAPVRFDVIRKRYIGRVALEYNTAVVSRPAIMVAAMGETLQTIPRLSINIYKQVEMYKNFKNFVPPQLWNDPLYRKPEQETVLMVKEEKKKRKKFRGDLNEFKSKSKFNKEMKAQLEKIAFEEKVGKGKGDQQIASC